MTTRLFVVACALIAAGCGSAAPEATAVAVADVALYDGPDRLQMLIDGARREGELTVYTSAQSNDLGAVVEAFESKYGIKASVWRAGVAPRRDERDASARV